MPKGLKWDEKYQFLLVVWCENALLIMQRFEDSEMYLTHLGGTIIFLKHVDLNDIRMAGIISQKISGCHK